MKKSALVIFLMCTTFAAFSQITIGVRGGLNYANFTGSEVKEWGFANVDPTGQIKFHLGGYVDYILTDQISLQGGLFYSAKGPKYDGTIEVYDFNSGESMMAPIIFKKRLGYIDVPILVHFHLTESISVFAGPQISFLISAKVKNDASAEVLEMLGVDEIEDVKDDYRGIDLGLPIGVAYNLGNGFNIQLNYDIGLIKIAKGYDYDGGNGNDRYFNVKNGVVKLSIGYVLRED